MKFDWMQRVLELALLGICSWEDVKGRQIRQCWLIAFGIEAVLVSMVFGSRSALSLVAGLLPGCVLLLLSWLSRGGVGEGDGLLLMLLGLSLGVGKTLAIFYIAAILSAGYAMFLVVCKKKSRKYAMAFVPFLLVAYVCYLCV